MADRLVLDASAAGVLVLREPREVLREALRTWMASGLRFCLPSLWYAEVGNLLMVAERRGRITPQDADEAATIMLSLPVDVDSGEPDSAFHEARSIAREMGVSFYDAVYLELARRTRSDLATADERQYAAAKSMAIPVIE